MSKCDHLFRAFDKAMFDGVLPLDPASDWDGKLFKRRQIIWDVLMDEMILHRGVCRGCFPR